MNEQNRKTILKHIDKIEQYAKTDPWLMGELRRRFGGGNDEPILRVEKYLGLDYALDSAESMIDYSFVTDKYIRNQLESDFREMLRYRYGVRSHKIDFDEFCRYAHLQAEALVNYYYKTSCGDYYSIKQRILKFNDKAKFSDEYTDVESVSYAYKIKACISELFPSTNGVSWFSNKGQLVFDTLSQVKDVRNSKSHRGKENNLYQKICDYEDRAIENGMPWNDLTKDFDMKKVKESVKFSDIYNLYFKKEHSKYKFGLWYLQKPFDLIIEAIKSLSIKIKDSIIN